MRTARPCPVCAGSARMMRRYTDPGLARCRSCGHVFAARRPTEAELDRHYATYPQDDVAHPLTLLRYDELLDRLEPFRRLGRLLDVGAGDGHFLKRAQERGWEAHGTEFSDAKIEAGQARGLVMHRAPWRAAEAAGTFDIVTGFEVIEHLADPLEELRSMAALARKGGAVWLTTPNFSAATRRLLGPRWRPIDYPEHLGYFTVRALDAAAARAGLRRVEARTTGLSAGARPAHAAPAPPATQAADPGHVALEHRLRSRMTSSRALRRGVALANRILSATRSGETIQGLYEKP